MEFIHIHCSSPPSEESVKTFNAYADVATYVAADPELLTKVGGSKFIAIGPRVVFRSRRFRLVGKEESDNCTFVVLQDRKNGRRVAMAVTCLPKGKFKWLNSFGAVRSKLSHVHRKYDCTASLFVANFNADFKSKWVQVLVKALAPSYTLTWRLLGIEGGTHHQRIIDATLVKGDMVVERSARLFGDDVSSDHRPYIEHLRYR